MYDEPSIALLVSGQVLPMELRVPLAGGGLKGGYVHGATDEFGYAATENRVGVPDLMATVLHQLGLDHERLSFNVHGTNETLTDAKETGARVVRDLFA